MFANSVISRSSISISSLLLSSLPSPFLSLFLTNFLLIIFSPCLCPADSFLPLVWFCASSECNPRASRRYALSRHIRPLRNRSLSLPLPTVRPSLSPTAAPFIHLPCGSSVSVSSTPLHRPVRRIRLTRHRSKCLVLYPPLSLSLRLFGKTSRSVEPICSLLSRLFSRVNSDISG